MDCLFCNIAQHKLPTTFVVENEQLMAFHDINPQAPLHVLIVPKQHIATINDAKSEHALLLGQMMLTAQDLAMTHDVAVSGYRLVVNTNQHGGQTVQHVHLHLLAGRPMTWPPG